MPSRHPHRRRVVVTGLGAVSGFGVGVEALWSGLEAGRSALRPIARFDAGGFPCRLASEVGSPAQPFSARDYVPKSYRKAVKVMARDIELAVAAARCAVEDARLVTRGTRPEGEGEATGAATTYPSPRMGCQIGAGLIAAEADELTAALSTAVRPDPARPDGPPVFSLRAWGTAEGGGGGMDSLTPLWLLKYLPNMLACHVTIIHGAEGPSNTITCAEASGLLSLGESCRVIERGDADLCFSGGAESPVNPMRLLRMDLAGRLAHTGEATDGAAVVRPYDAQAPGSLLGEGAGILVLEEREAALRRGARVYAEVAGFAASHSTPPRIPSLPESGAPAGASEDGLVLALRNAVADAGIGPGDVDAIVPHAAGIRSMDAREAGALREVFGERLASVPLVTLTPGIGDCLAGSGGLAAAVGAVCLHRQRLPARVHAGTPAPGIDAGRAGARDARLRHVVVATSALGGQNAAIVLRAAS